MEQYDRYELHGPEREETLTRILTQIAEWGLKMPPITPIPFHFGLDRFMEIGETEFWVANEPDLGYCGKFLFVFNAQTCPYHHHLIKHETFFVVKGSVRMRFGSEERVMNQGDVLIMPAGVGHSFIGIGSALLLEASMPSTLHDNFFADQQIGENGVI
jgi:N-acetylneuraminate synthase